MDRVISTARSIGARSARVAALVIALSAIVAAHAAADPVTDWNQIAFGAIRTGNVSPLMTSRIGAIVSAAVYDAVNGIERRYTAIYVAPAAPRGASERAGAIQAACTALEALFPAQLTALQAQCDASLDAIASGDAADSSESIARGRDWGESVAHAILAWRANDLPPLPPYLGSTDIGKWRPTPPNFAPGASPQFATMNPWVIVSPSQFRPAGPPALSSAAYAADLNETKDYGRVNSTLRTVDQTTLAQFWNGNTGAFWNRIALQVADERHLTMSENARLFALLNIAMADAAIACWDAKYTYVFWRPITAIVNANLDGNDLTTADPAWTPLLGVTPAHPEYPSGHSTVSSSAATVLAAYFGDNTPFTIDSEVTPGVIRSFPSFSAAESEIMDARVFGGIHFRTATIDGRATGAAVAQYVLDHAAVSLHGERVGQVTH